MRHATVAPLAVISFLAAGPALAQGRTQTNTQAANNLAVSPEVIGLSMSADLVARDLGLSALGEIVFTLVNRGSIAVNPGTRRVGGSSNAPIKIDLYMGSALVQSVYQTALGGKASRVFTVAPVSGVPKCKESRDLRVVVDPQNAIQEWSNDNNTASATAARPCPDLAVKSIERNHSGLLNETYTPEVTVINLGNAPSPSNQVWGTALSSAPGITGWPELAPTHTIPGLAPGQTTKFKIGGSVLSVDNSWVRVILDRFFEIEELEEGNNFVEKKL